MDLKHLNFNTVQSKILISLILFLPLSISGCDVIGGIFKTGVGVGAFVVILVVVLIVAFVMMGRRR